MPWCNNDNIVHGDKLIVVNTSLYGSEDPSKLARTELNRAMNPLRFNCPTGFSPLNIRENRLYLGFF